MVYNQFKSYLSLKVLQVEAKKRPQLKKDPTILEYDISGLESMPKEIESLYIRLKNLNLLQLCQKKDQHEYQMTEELIQSSIHHSLVTEFQLLGEDEAPIGILNHVLKIKTDHAFKALASTNIANKNAKEIYQTIINQRIGYIRFKICCPKGCYPGSPAVMEIWPPFYCSPIHNHGQAFCLIKVLMGQIRVQNFQDLSLQAETKPYFKCSYPKGEYTWLSEDSFGVHRVMNLHSHTAITLQGYYDNRQGIDEYFTFIEKNSERKEKQFVMYYPQHDWENYLNKRSIENEEDKNFIDKVVGYYNLQDKQTGKIDCSYGKFVITLIKEYNALKKIIDMQ